MRFPVNETEFDDRQCSRVTAKGARCRSGRLCWSREISLPDPHSCIGHLTTEERAAWNADRPRRRSSMLLFGIIWKQLITSDPACWSWSAPTSTDLEQLRASFSARPRELFDADDAWGSLVMAHWHAGRCAICGHERALVEDHDHRTGLVRGWLCRSCNTLEGAGHGGVFAKYRSVSPATICGVRERYWNPFTKEYAEPVPPPADPWKDNPMRGVGL